MKRVGLMLLTILGLVVLTEFSLRLFGLGAWITYEQSSVYEYFQKPNQSFTRFGNHYSTNSLGMRASPEIESNTKLRILKFGDSVLNGGAKVTDNEVVSKLIEDSLVKSNIKVEVFNISAGSWGPENAFNYLQSHQDLNPDIIVLLFSSHDYYDNMHFKKVVGNHPNWPEYKPFCAIHDLWSKWLKYKLGAVVGLNFNELNYLDGVVDTTMNPGWSNFFSFSKNNEIPLLVYVHPEKSEIENKVWSQSGKLLMTWLKENQLNYVNGLEKGYKTNSYEDNIHLNATGHESIAENIFPSLLEVIQKHGE